MLTLREVIRSYAERQFARDPDKCFQRIMGEAWASARNRQQIPTLGGAVVERVDNAVAADLIRLG